MMGWVSTCFFGLGIPIGLFQTFDKRPQIVITENGIWDRTTHQDEIKWEQIIEAYPIDIHGQKFISLVTVFKKKTSRRAAAINQFIGAQKLNLRLGQINIDEIELTNFINQITKETIEERRRSIKNFKIKEGQLRILRLKKPVSHIQTYRKSFFISSSLLRF